MSSAESRDQLNDANQLGGPSGALNARGQLEGASGRADDANGLLLNQDRIFLRRLRARVSDSFRRGSLSADYVVQVDANTIAGTTLGLRDAEVGIGWSSAPAGPPTDAPAATFGAGPSAPSSPARLAATVPPDGALQVRLGVGIFRTPFGHDVSEMSHADRLFSEPSLLANAFFPGDYDAGARLSLNHRDVFLVLALQNGEPLGERSFPSRDPNAAKDWFVRFGSRASPLRRVRIESALSLMHGVGFHPGTPPTKDTLVWRDFNEDGIAQQPEIQVIRGASPTPSENFDRWGLGADARINVDLPIGHLLVFGEAAVGVDLDRGVRPADPVLLGSPQRGVTVHAGLVQELGSAFYVGTRVDYYNANLDEADTQGGTLVRFNQPFTNLAFAGALRLLESDERRGRARIIIEYAIRRDRLGRDSAGRPADLSNDRLTLRLQLEI